MKIIFILLSVFTLTMSSYGQTATYENIQNLSRKPNIEMTEYISENGASFKIGETLKIGSPSGDRDRYVYIDDLGLLGDSVGNVDISSKDFESEIIKFKIIGTRRKGYEVLAITKTEAGGSRYHIKLEQAVKYGEVQTSILTREQAIKKLKEAKDLLDLEMMTKSEYEKIKEKLTPIIMDK